MVLRADSRLVVEQLAGRWKVRNAALQALHARARDVASRFTRVRYEHVPRESNAAADRLANAGVDAWLGRGL